MTCFLFPLPPLLLFRALCSMAAVGLCKYRITLRIALYPFAIRVLRIDYLVAMSLIVVFMLSHT